MKSQIISKLTQPAHQSTLLNDSFRPHHLITFSTQSSSHQDYYPSVQPTTLTPHQFMNQLNQHCQLRYEKVAHQPQPLQRKLEGLLEKKAPKVPRHTTINLFSFKKAEQPQATQRSQNKENNYYIRPSHSQKQRLRKFHSLASLRSQESTEEESQQCGNASQVVAVERGNSRRKQQARRQKVTIAAQVNEGRGEAAQKQRLARIRRELNEIYQMGRNKVRLCLG